MLIYFCNYRALLIIREITHTHTFVLIHKKNNFVFLLIKFTSQTLISRAQKKRKLFTKKK